MEEINQKIGNLPLELARLSKPARKHLKTLAASLLHYHKDLPAREPELFPPGKAYKDSRYE
jgi:hypothetical protein